MNEPAPHPRRIETTVLARCAYCGRTLYAEAVTDVRTDDGAGLVETNRHATGDPSRLRCDCREVSCP